MKNLSIRGASWDSIFLTLGKVLTMLFSILSAKIMSEGLSLAEYGTYSQANLVSSVGTSLILLGLGDALCYYFSRKMEEIDDQLRNRIVNTVFFLEILVGLLFAALVIFGRFFLVNYFENPAVRILLPVVAFLPVLSNLIYFYQVVYVAVGKAKLMSIYSLAMTLVRIITIYFAVYVLRNLLLIYIVLVLQDVIQILIYNVTLVKKNVKINPLKISKKHMLPILEYGLPMGIYAITTTFSRELGKLVVGKLAGTEELAIYTNCSKPLPIDIIVTSFALVLVPYIIRYVSENNREKSIALFSHYLRIGYYSVWILGTMLLVAPSTVISLLYDDKYLLGTAVFVLYVLESMLRFACMHQVMIASNKTKMLMFFSFGSLVLNFILTVFFYYMLGLIGPALAALISTFVYTLLVVNKSIKLIHAKWTDVFDFKEMAWLLLTLGGLWLLCSMLFKGLVLIGVHSYISLMLAMAVFGCSALVIHIRKISDALRQINKFRI